MYVHRRRQRTNAGDSRPLLSLEAVDGHRLQAPGFTCQSCSVGKLCEGRRVEVKRSVTLFAAVSLFIAARVNHNTCLQATTEELSAPHPMS